MNKEWVEKVAGELKDLFDSTSVQNYKHWQDDTGLIDINHELDILIKDVQNMEGNYAIFAKSAGTLVTMKGISDGVLKPKFCVFTGVPFKWAQEQGIPVNDWINALQRNVLILQKTHDPVLGYQELKDFLGEHGIKDITIIEIQRNNHHYENIQQIHGLTQTFMNNL